MGRSYLLLFVVVLCGLPTWVTAACSGNNCASCLKSDKKCAWCETDQSCAVEEPFPKCPRSCQKTPRFDELPDFCSAAPCASFTNCKACATNNCVWCAGTNTCSAGGSSGATPTCPDDKCDSSCSQYKQFDKLPELCPAIADCGTKTDCASCTKEGCGWCASSETCVAVSKMRGATLCPTTTKCNDAFGCLKYTESQPLKSCPAYKCSAHKNCGSCLSNDGQCSWCATSQQCMERSKNTGACGDCSGAFCAKTEKKDCPALTFCSELKDCGSCKNTAGCGWCASSQQCLELGSSGSICEKGCMGNCGKVHKDSSACPAPESKACSAYTSCTTCTADKGCGWMTDEQKCVEAGPTGDQCNTQAAKVWSFKDCHGECLGRAANCTHCLQGTSEVRCGFCEGYTAPTTRLLGPLESTCVLTNEENNGPKKTDYRCMAYTPNPTAPTVPTTAVEPQATAADSTPSSSLPFAPVPAPSSSSSSASSSSSSSSVSPFVAALSAEGQCSECAQYTTPQSCQDQSLTQGCGWCNGKCVRGRPDGPFRALDCGPIADWQTREWSWAHSSVQCSAFTTCDGCTGMRNCGWCQSSVSCRHGNEDGPYEGKCEYPGKLPIEPNPWNINRTMCKVTTCSSYNGDCTLCMKDDRCGWCPAGGCMSADATGPLSTSISCSNFRFNNTARCDNYCAQYTEFNGCQKDTNCGWCGQKSGDKSAKCVPGDDKRPYYMQCAPYYYAGRRADGGSDKDPSNPDGGLSTGAIVGIAVGGVAVFAGVGYFVMKRQQAAASSIATRPLLG